ncbi:MAG: KH domain-containing protein [Candidatus Eremiobacteraeota bacterium]|nr:KH domain-containing protein [Candidatus Eremiobacteraeota bacterium]
MARKLVQKPESVHVELFVDEEGEPVIELVVDPDDLGKVIGRSGRVAQALRTVVRATAEGRVAVDILDSAEASQNVEQG